MSKYIPKVGEAFQFIDNIYNCWVQGGKVIAETHTEIAYLYESNGEIRTLKKDRRFFPIQTKSDVEREILIDIVKKNRVLAEGRVQLIQEAGFTIPKKVKRSDVLAIISDWTDLPNVLTTEICTLLGDLVEQDEKGGVL